MSDKARKNKAEMGAVETLKDIPNRLLSLVWNLVSRWGVALGLTFFLIMKGYLQDWYSVLTWIIFMLFYLFKTEAPEMLDKILKIKGLK